MRLRELNLDAFGHFLERRIDFGPRAESDFHIVHGPNEAGKTTLMEGFLRLLYGFPTREPYAFQHQRKMLRVSALLEIEEMPRRFTRRATRAPSLSDAHDTPLPDAVLQGYLGGLDVDGYRKLFCLDDDTIETGGEEIARSKGDIGHLLFSAAAGISDLSAVLDTVREEADALYRKRSSKTEMARLKAELAEVEQALKDGDVTATRYRSLKQDLQRAQDEEHALREDRKALSETREGLRAKLAALPQLEDLSELDRQIAQHAHYPEGLDLSPDALVDLLTRQTRADADHRRWQDEIETLQAQRDAIAEPPNLRDLGEALSTLEDLRSRHISAEMDLARRRAELLDTEDSMRHVLRDLDLPRDAAPQDLVPGKHTMAKLSDTRDALRAAERDAAGAQAELGALSSRLTEAQAALARLETSDPDQRAVFDLLRRYGADRLAAEHAAASRAHNMAQATLHSALADLGRDALPPCPVTPAQMAELVQQADQITTARDEARARVRDLRDETAASAAEAEQMKQGEGLFDDATVEASRAARDGLWQDHLAHLTPDSAAAFRVAMDRAEAMADKRLAQARSLARLREIETAHAKQLTRLDLAEADLAEIEARHLQHGQRLTELAEACDLPASSSITALSDWVNAHATAQRAAAERTALETQHAALFAKADALLAALEPLLGLQEPGLDEALSRAREIARLAEARDTEEKAAKRRLADLQTDLAQRQARQYAASARAEAASTDWADLVRDSFAGRVPADRLHRDLSPLHELQQLEIRRRGLAHQVDRMQADQDAFAARVRSLITQHGAPPGSGDPLADFDRLNAMTRASEAAIAELRRLDQSLTEAKAGQTQAAEARASLAARHQHIAAAFDSSIATTTLTELRDAVRLAIQTDEARAARRKLVTRLCLSLDMPDIDALRAAMATASAPALQAEIDTLDADLARLDTALDQAIETRSAAARDLSAVTGDADMARLSARKATLELELEEAALRYLELQFGHRLADDAIRRYRDVHRSEMMAATERAFAALTHGAYPSLRADMLGAQETLVAIDAEGRAKQAQDMSKGTRFQLYLALRAAAYEQLVDKGLRLPFFCDDIFETFDEDRTRAACDVMDRIGQLGQAIYLTHHAHVVDIAREICGDRVRVHRL